MFLHQLKYPIQPMTQNIAPLKPLALINKKTPAIIEDQTEIKRITERNEYLFGIFSRSLEFLIDNERFAKLNAGRFEVLWLKIVDAHAGRYFFNLDYLFRTFKTYEEYVREIQSEFFRPLCMALFLQRIGPRTNTFAMNAERAYKILTEDFGVTNVSAKIVENLIKSLVNFNEPPPAGDIKPMILKNLILSHLGVDYPTFLDYQKKIYEEKLQLTRPEHYNCQIAICREILKMNRIFQCKYFYDTFEEQARINLIKYLEVLDEKVLIYQKTVESDATRIAKMRAKQEDDLALEVLENEGYNG